MLEFIVFGLAVLIGLALLSVALKALGGGIRDFAVITRGVMDLVGVRFEAGQSRRQRVTMAVMTLLIAAGILSGISLFVVWVFN